MDKILYFEIITLCVSILGVMLYSDIRQLRGPVLIGQRLFRYLLLDHIIVMLVDAVAVFYDGTDYPYSKMFVTSGMCLYYISHSFAGYLLLLYVDFELYADRERLFRRLPFYSILVSINVLLSVASLRTGWYFVVDESNSYQRGNIWYIFTLLSLIYALHSIAITVKRVREIGLETRIGREQLKRMGILPLLPCIGAVMQGVMPGSSWAFSSTAVALLINYIALQNRQISRDHLTGLYNRGYLEFFLNNQFRNLKKGSYAFLILLDLDRFKSINDTFGHLVGDDALIETANLLRNNCKRRQDFVVRLGGDEFVIVGTCNNETTVEAIVERMERMAVQFNETGIKPYQISFSIGYTLAEAGRDVTLDQLISIADQKMYVNKRAKKERRN